MSRKIKSFGKKYLALFLSILFFAPPTPSSAETKDETPVQGAIDKASQVTSESKLDPRSQNYQIPEKAVIGALPEKPTILVNDISRLNSTYVTEVLHPQKVLDLQNAIREAKEKKLKVSMAGKQHSQGGHTVYDGALMLNMRQFNKVLSLDQKNKIVTVQSGASWEEIQDYVNPYGFSIKVMQASNIFTVGGSLSSNVHGEDPNFGPIIETVRSFRLLLADGSIVNVSRTENPELFKLVIGGFGLFGVILDVDLTLTDNDVYEGISEIMDYKDYPAFFEKQVKNNSDVGNQSAKLSIAPESFLRETVVTTYRKLDQRPEKIFDLHQEKNIKRNQFLFGLSRRFDWGKSLRWFLQKRLEAKVGAKQIVSRNNAMRPIVKFLDYNSPKDTDILQEYFVPKGNLIGFIDGLREIIKSDKVNLISVTIRYLPKNTEAYLSYAREESFAVVMYINQPLSKEGTERARTWTRKIVDLALKNRGTYYLTYQLYPTHAQFLEAYPDANFFFEKKQFYDSGNLFMNKFYEKYTHSPQRGNSNVNKAF